MELRYTDKVNALSPEARRLRLSRSPVHSWVGSAEKGSVERLSYVNIAYSGTGKRAGVCHAGGLGTGAMGRSLDVRRNVARNLQLSVRYEGVPHRVRARCTAEACARAFF